MKTTFLEFVKKQKAINEAKISISNLDKYVELIENILKKHINGLVPLVGYVKTKSDDVICISKQFMVVKDAKDVQLIQINWRQDQDTYDAYSIDIFKNMDYAFDKTSTADITLNTLNSSIVYFIPIIVNIINGKNYSLNNKEAYDLAQKVFKSNDVKESYIDYGLLRYHIFEANSDKVQDKFNELQKAYGELDGSESKRNAYLKLSDEYQELLKAIRGGNSNIGDVNVEVKNNKKVSVIPSEEQKKCEDKLKEESDDPNTAFKKMDGYINMVIKGLNPSLIICGAPGVGKTFRVKQALKKGGYEDGKNLFIIKGKCTPRALYTALYNYKDKGDIIMIDDADGLVGPKAPEESINILKGALDSTSDEQGRLVSYGIAGKITDENGKELPKRFYYNGGVIVITNYQAGSLDTALKGRSYVQDIHFSTDACLAIVYDLLPKLGDGAISTDNKIKAYNYLVKLSKTTEFEISIRTFIICAKLFESMNDDELAKEMIKEQMNLQTIRTKEKY